jgi:hypothetical protein
MKKLASLFVFFLFLTPVFAQKPTPTPAQNPEDDVVRITTNIVQVDAIVTDKDGNQITNLKAEDFEIIQDDKPQKITNFSYVNKSVLPIQNEKPSKKDEKINIPPPITDNC